MAFRSSVSLAVSALALLAAAAAAAVGGSSAGGGQPEEKPSAPAAPAAAASDTNLVKNGDFTSGKDTPDGWSKMDKLATFWIDGGPDVEKAAAEKEKAEGKCLKIDTDVYLKEWEEHRKSAEAGKPGDAKAKTPTKGDKYDTVAGTKGVAVYSDEIAVKPGAAYKLSVAVKGSVKADDFFFPKVFVKGYADVNGESREVYNTYLACRLSETGKWASFAREFHPTKNTPAVRKMKVMIYAYWPPGIYQFDDVKISEVAGKSEGGGGGGEGARTDEKK